VSSVKTSSGEGKRGSFPCEFDVVWTATLFKKMPVGIRHPLVLKEKYRIPKIPLK
jgi:hypothetical protein